MPVSIWLGLEDCLQAVVESRPQSVLEAGIGFGLLGHALRQYLDVWEGRLARTQWRVRIDGIEIDATRVHDHQRYLYDDVLIGDIRELVPACAAARPYDVILFGDVLEHLPKEDATLLLRRATTSAVKLVVVRIPLGHGWRKEGREPPDHHRSTWSMDDFDAYIGAIRQYDYFGNAYGLATIDAAASRLFALERADRRLAAVEACLGRMPSRPVGAHRGGD